MIKHIGLVAYAVQSKGPVPSGLMLEGSAHLAGLLLKFGFRPRVFDYNTVKTVRIIAEQGKKAFVGLVVEELGRYIEESGAKLLGFTLYNNGFKDVVEIVSRLKRKYPEVMYAAGGPLVGWFGEHIYKYTKVFDVLCEGEGDITFPRLAQHVYDGLEIANVPNLILPDGKKTERMLMDISKLTFPVYDKEYYPDIESKIQVPVVRGSVGCRYGKCSFCIQPKIDGKFRVREHEDVVNEILNMREKYGYNYFRLSDPNPTPGLITYLADNLPQGVKFCTFNYTDQLYNLEKAKDRLIGIFLGVESFQEETLVRLSKTLNPKKYIEDAKSLIKRAKELGIPNVVAIIAPTHNDTSDRIVRDCEVIKKVMPDFVVSLPLAPMPGTEDYKKAVRNGESSGIKLSDKFIEDFMLYEIDLLLPPSEWPKLPFTLKVDGEFVENPFLVNKNNFLGPLKEYGFEPICDEIILMAYLYYGGLDMNQAVRRKQVTEFNNKIRDVIAGLDHEKLKDIVGTINENQKK